MTTAPAENRAILVVTPRRIAIGGIALGVIAFWLSLPPLSTTSP